MLIAKSSMLGPNGHVSKIYIFLNKIFMLLSRVLNYIHELAYCQSNYKNPFCLLSNTGDVTPIKNNYDRFAPPFPYNFSMKLRKLTV